MKKKQSKKKKVSTRNELKKRRSMTLTARQFRSYDEGLIWLNIVITDKTMRIKKRREREEIRQRRKW